MIEVLIVSAIFAILGSILFVSILAPMESFQQLERRNRIDHVARFLTKKLNEDLGSAVSLKNHSRGFLLGENSGIGDRRLDQIHFTSFSHNRGFLAERESDQAEVGYYNAHDPVRDLSTLYRREDPVIDGDRRSGGDAFPVTDQLEAFSIRYRDSSGEWVDKWDTETNPVLPEAVRVEFVLRDEEGESHTFVTTVAIPG